MKAKQCLKRLLIAKLLPKKSHFKKLKEKNYHRPILSLEEGNIFIKKLLNSEKPMLICRFGGVELQCCAYYHKHIHNKERYYSESTKNGIHYIAGFFPISNYYLDEFAKLYLDSMRRIDAVGVWFNPGENLIAKQYCPKAELLRPRSIEPYYHNEPWSAALFKKKVLIIHPFAETIKEQFKKKESLFVNKNILPDFELKTLKAVQSLAGLKPNFSTWFEALNYMCEEIKKIDFDVAIIGAGAYGLPLAAFVKKIGKKSIHMGGATQILFGIKGQRWDKHDFISKLYNIYWVRPAENETPSGYRMVEGGSYW